MTATLPQLQLLFAVHHHQPDGNFGHVFAAAYADCYEPFLAFLENTPQLKTSLHHTGPLLEWILKNEPGYFRRLRALVERDQVELLGGGFYEPMLAVLPERDALGQISYMNDFLAEHFGVRPLGMWLAERVWEPGLVTVLARAGIRYTLLDDGHFRNSTARAPLRGYYITEKAGDAVAIFPIDQRLRKVVPFSQPHEAISTIERIAGEAPGAVTYGDDGEKFGLWPGTKKWVWKEHWLRNFMQLANARPDLVAFKTAGEYFRERPPSGRVYLPTASYDEMGEWAMHVDDVPRHLQLKAQLGEPKYFGDNALSSGIWQNFLAKYSEADLMHKRMIEVSNRLADAEASAPHSGGDSHAYARSELYRAQCNCVYWHGLFGGLYLSNLRDAVYRHILEAELALTKDEPVPQLTFSDIDLDGVDEVRLRSRDLFAYVKPAHGGTLLELDYLPRRFNVTNVLTRRREPYHKGSVAYDALPRGSFRDRFLAEDVSVDALKKSQFTEFGTFADATYEIVKDARSADALELELHANAAAYGHALAITKTFRISSTALTCRYRLESDSDLVVHFASELNLTMLAGAAEDRYYEAKTRERLDCTDFFDGHAISLVNEWDQFAVRVAVSGSSRPTGIWRYPIETVSQSEDGSEKLYQGSCLLPFFRNVRLNAKQPFTAEISLTFAPHQAATAALPGKENQ